jgi:hypothetical protein
MAGKNLEEKGGIPTSKETGEGQKIPSPGGGKP